MNTMDVTKLPESLRPLLPLFEEWGDATSDTGRYALMDRALGDPAAMEELKEWHRRWIVIDPASWENWLDDGPLTGNFERAKVYFTHMLLYGELEIEKR